MIKERISLKRRGATEKRKSTTMPLRESRNSPRISSRMKRQNSKRGPDEEGATGKRVEDAGEGDCRAGGRVNRSAEKVAAFPKEMDAAVAKAVKEMSERLNLEAKNRDEIQKRNSLVREMSSRPGSNPLRKP